MGIYVGGVLVERIRRGSRTPLGARACHPRPRGAGTPAWWSWSGRRRRRA